MILAEQPSNDVGRCRPPIELGNTQGYGGKFMVRFCQVRQPTKGWCVGRVDSGGETTGRWVRRAVPIHAGVLRHGGNAGRSISPHTSEVYQENTAVRGGVSPIPLHGVSQKQARLHKIRHGLHAAGSAGHRAVLGDPRGICEDADGGDQHEIAQQMGRV